MTEQPRPSAPPTIPSFFGEHPTESLGSHLRISTIWSEGLPATGRYGRNRALSTDIHIRARSVGSEDPDAPDLVLASPYGVSYPFRLNPRTDRSLEWPSYVSDAGWPALYCHPDPLSDSGAPAAEPRPGYRLTQLFPDGSRLTFRRHDWRAPEIRYELSAVHDPDGAETVYVYGAAGHPALLREIRLPGGGRVAFEYEAHGRAISLLDVPPARLLAVRGPAGQAVNFEYAADGRLEFVRFPDGSATHYAESAPRGLLRQAVADAEGRRLGSGDRWFAGDGWYLRYDRLRCLNDALDPHPQPGLLRPEILYTYYGGGIGPAALP